MIKTLKQTFLIKVTETSHQDKGIMKDITLIQN